MSTDPKLPDYVRSALVRLRAAHPADAPPASGIDVDGVLERVLRDLPTAEALPELPGLSDSDWDSPDADIDPDGGDDGGGPDGSGTPDGGAGGPSADASIGAGDAVDVLPDTGAGSLASILAAPISVGKALLTLALPAALAGGLVTFAVQPIPPDHVGTGVAPASSIGEREAAATSGRLEEAPIPEPTANPVEPEAVAVAPSSAPPSPQPSAGAAAAADLGVTEDAPPVDTLPAERRLIDAARAAMAHRDPESCMRFVAQHRRRFQDGALAEERDALDVRCRVMSGDPGATQAAEEFRRRYPSSFQLGLRNE